MNLKRLLNELINKDKGNLSQKALAEILDCSQPSIAKMLKTGSTSFERGIQIVVAHYIFVVCKSKHKVVVENTPINSRKRELVLT